MSSRELWILDDDYRFVQSIARNVTVTFPGLTVRRFVKPEDFLRAVSIKDLDNLPVLLVVDWNLPLLDSGDGGALPDVAQAFRRRWVDVPIVYFTATPDRVVFDPLDLTIYVFDKNEPNEFYNALEALLVSLGFSPSEIYDRIEGMAHQPALVWWQRKAWIMGGVSAASGLWVATILPVVSTLSGKWNAFLVLLGCLGGIAIGWSSSTNGRWRVRSAIIGSALIISAALILPVVLTSS